MDDEAETHVLSPEVSMFARHATAPNLLRLAWLPQSKISSFVGLSADGTAEFAISIVSCPEGVQFV